MTIRTRTPSGCSSSATDSLKAFTAASSFIALKDMPVDEDLVGVRSTL